MPYAMTSFLLLFLLHHQHHLLGRSGVPCHRIQFRHTTKTLTLLITVIASIRKVLPSLLSQSRPPTYPESMHSSRTPPSPFSSHSQASQLYRNLKLLSPRHAWQKSIETERKLILVKGSPPSIDPPHSPQKETCVQSEMTCDKSSLHLESVSNFFLIPKYIHQFPSPFLFYLLFITSGCRPLC